MIFDNNYDYILNNNNGYNNICYDITKTQIIQTQIQINHLVLAVQLKHFAQIVFIQLREHHPRKTQT